MAIENSDIQGITLDQNGNVFVSGTAIDPTTGAQNVLTAAFDSSLNMLYADTLSVPDANMQTGSSTALGSGSIAVDSSDNTYIIGTFAPNGGSDFSPIIVAFNGFNNQMLWPPVHYANPVAPGPGYSGGIVYQSGSIYGTTSLLDNAGATPLSSDLVWSKLDSATGSPTSGHGRV